MSRSYAVLVAALVGIGALSGIARLLEAESSREALAETAALPDEIEPAQTGLAETVRDAVGLEPAALIEPDCSLSVWLELGDRHDEVACLESQLIDAGVLVNSAPDDVFDAATQTAVKAFQTQSGLVADGIVGPRTAAQLGPWLGPDVMPPDSSTCPTTGRSAVVDRFNQRTWLCESGEITDLMPMTTAISQPDPGTYTVYAKDRNASSTIGGEYSTMTHFVAFTHGKNQGARIAFHSVPTYSNGEFVQPLESVGTAALYGDSAGCIRVLPDDAELIWNWLDIGDTVTVVT